MKNAASGWNNRNLINNIVQVNFIALFFVLFFALARVSELYGTVWSDSFTGLVDTGLVISTILLLVMIAGIVLLQIKGGFIKPDYRDVTVCALLITIHYLIRAGLVGTVQLDEGLTCYESLEKLLYNPDIIIFLIYFLVQIVFMLVFPIISIRQHTFWRLERLRTEMRMVTAFLRLLANSLSPAVE